MYVFFTDAFPQQPDFYRMCGCRDFCIVYCWIMNDTTFAKCEDETMSASNSRNDSVYLEVLSGFCLLLCGTCSVYFVGMDLDAWHGVGVVPPSIQVQALCFLGTVCAAAFSLLRHQRPINSVREDRTLSTGVPDSASL
jgi:hypothetical protein